MGDNVANSQEMKDMQTYLKGKLVSLQEELTEAEERQDAKVEETDKTIDEITGTKLMEMSTIGSRATSAAADAIAQAMDQQQHKEATGLGQQEAQVMAALDGETQAATQKMNEQEAAIENSMTKSFDSLQEGLNQASYKATQITTQASTATQAFNAAVAAIQRSATGAGETAVRMTDELERHEKHLEDVVEGAKARDAAEMDDAIKGVNRATNNRRNRDVEKIEDMTIE